MANPVAILRQDSSATGFGESQQNEISYRNNSSSCGFVVSVWDDTNVAARQVSP